MERWWSFQRRLEESILAYGILAIAVLMIANVVTRSFLDFSLTFAQELSQFLIVLVCFVGLSYAASQRRHIRMTALVEQLGAGPRRGVEVWISVTTALLLFGLTAWSIQYVVVMADLGSVSPVLSVPLYLVYLTAPLGFLLSGLRYIHQARLWWSGRVEEALQYENEDPDTPPSSAAI